jgi:hypothetical protein
LPIAAGKFFGEDKYFCKEKCAGWLNSSVMALSGRYMLFFFHLS